MPISHDLPPIFHHGVEPQHFTVSADYQLRKSPPSSPDYSSAEDNFPTTPRSSHGGGYNDTHSYTYNGQSVESWVEPNIRNHPSSNHAQLAPPSFPPHCFSPSSPYSDLGESRQGYSSDSEYGSDATSGSAIKREQAGYEGLLDQWPIGTSDSFGQRFIPKKKVVATTKIIEAASNRRIHSARVLCNVCGDNFTTTFARDRHMVSHTGRRAFPCTKKGCHQKFSTDSGRKRHEKSPTLHKSCRDTAISKLKDARIMLHPHTRCVENPGDPWSPSYTRSST
ncbi:hypothetical protein HWV62_23685 [Athelia sp. TMB]|nr:hypothetical protein HWV62_23685 [Athelia sp. TMB]